MQRLQAHDDDEQACRRAACKPPLNRKRPRHKKGKPPQCIRNLAGHSDEERKEEEELRGCRVAQE
eukprot:12565923-Alexandrium_andersonii.AAC.1